MKEIVGDWYFTPEELEGLRRADEEFYRKNPNHPRTIAARKHREERLARERQEQQNCESKPSK